MDKSFEWIKSAIASSCNLFHLECCEVLIELFATKYKPECEDLYNLLLEDLVNKKTFLSVDA